MASKRIVWIIISALGALALWACNGEGTPPEAQLSCDAIQEIDSYRYTIDLRLDSPAFDQAIEGTREPLSEFADALAGLFSDMQMEGAFVAPDRNQVVLRFQDDELELRTIGDRSWIRVGATWQEQASPPEDGVILTPASVCEDLLADLAPSLAAASGEPEVVNQIETVRYGLHEADLQGLPELLGRGGGEGLPDEFAVDIWLQQDEGWPVKLEVAASDKDAEGNTLGLELSMQFSSINDPTIEIGPPPVSPSQAHLQ